MTDPIDGDQASPAPPPPVEAPSLVLTLDMAKKHLNVVSNRDDELIKLQLRAATIACEGYIERKLCATEEQVQALQAQGIRAVLLDDLLNAGILLMLGHLYANREEVVTGTIATRMPVGSEQCWAHKRYIGV